MKDRTFISLIVIYGAVGVIFTVCCYFAAGYLLYKGAEAASPYLKAAKEQLDITPAPTPNPEGHLISYPEEEFGGYVLAGGEDRNGRSHMLQMDTEGRVYCNCGKLEKK